MICVEIENRHLFAWAITAGGINAGITTHPAPFNNSLAISSGCIQPCVVITRVWLSVNGISIVGPFNACSNLRAGPVGIPMERKPFMPNCTINVSSSISSLWRTCRYFSKPIWYISSSSSPAFGSFLTSVGANPLGDSLTVVSALMRSVSQACANCLFATTYRKGIT